MSKLLDVQHERRQRRYKREDLGVLNALLLGDNTAAAAGLSCIVVPVSLAAVLCLWAAVSAVVAVARVVALVDEVVGVLLAALADDVREGDDGDGLAGDLEIRENDTLCSYLFQTYY